MALALALATACLCEAQPYCVSPSGNDANPGTLEKPFATLHRAQTAGRRKRGDVHLRSGTYYLSEPLVFTSQDSGTAESALAKPGLKANDVILSINGEKTPDTATLLRVAPAHSAGVPLHLNISRDQKEIVIRLAR